MSIKLGIFCALLIFCLAAGTPTRAETFTLRIGAGHPSAPIAYVDRMEHFFVPEVVRRVAETTEHEVNFIQAYAGTAAKIDEILEAVQMGLLDIGGWCPCFEPSKAFPLNIVYFLPFTTPDVRVQVRVMRQLIDEFPELHNYLEASYGQKLLAISGLDNYGLGTTFAWDTTDDLAGRKLLGAGPNLPWISGVGAIPMSSSLVTAYNQLATGAAEGFLSLPGSFYGFRLYEQAPHYKITNFGAMAQVILTMNIETRAYLPTEVVAIIDQVARELEVVATDLSHKKEISGLKKLADAGAVITEISPAAQTDWARAMIEWPNDRTQAINDFGIDGTTIMRRYIVLLEQAGHKFPVSYPIK
jgi:TRAP-type C4-dicarboxylate transport system substrate-binding protein